MAMVAERTVCHMPVEAFFVLLQPDLLISILVEYPGKNSTPLADFCILWQQSKILVRDIDELTKLAQAIFETCTS